MSIWDTKHSLGFPAPASSRHQHASLVPKKSVSDREPFPITSAEEVNKSLNEGVPPQERLWRECDPWWTTLNQAQLNRLH